MLLYRFSGLSRVLRIALPLVGAATLSACGGSGGGDDGPPQPPAANVTVSGKITFDRIPFKATGAGLNPGAPVESPARQVLVEAVDDANAILATATTDAAGNYTLQVPSNLSVKIRAKAQMPKTDAAPTWNFRVLNNTNSDALYALEGSASSTGTTNSTRNLRAASGWGTTSYTGTRAAAPFAILDTVYRAKELILTAAAGTVFPDLDLYWSEANRTGTSTSKLCPDTGDVGTSFYVGAGFSDECTASSSLPAGIYILGSFANGAGDTDEFDQHVIAHEFGHYVEDKFSRSDSIGGEHGSVDRLDLRVAFGEGWGNAYSAMVLNDSLYRDSAAGVSNESSFNLETGNTAVEGWFSEFSVAEILWDIFDGADEPGDTVSLGFTPIFSVMTNEQVMTDAFASIYSFASAIRARDSASTAAVDLLVSNELIFGKGSFGLDEVNFGNSPAADSSVLPVYRGDLTFDAAVMACTRAPWGVGNKLGFSRFFRFDNNTSRTVVVTAQGAVNPFDPSSVAAGDPDIYVYRRGTEIVSGFRETTPQQTTAPMTFAPGIYIIEVQDAALSDTSDPSHCMSVSLTGT